MMDEDFDWEGIKCRLVVDIENGRFTFFVERIGDVHPMHDERDLELWQVIERLRRLGISEKRIARFEADHSELGLSSGDE